MSRAKKSLGEVDRWLCGCARASEPRGSHWNWPLRGAQARRNYRQNVSCYWTWFTFQSLKNRNWSDGLVIPIESIAGMCDDLFRVFDLGALYQMTAMANNEALQRKRRHHAPM